MDGPRLSSSPCLGLRIRRLGVRIPPGAPLSPLVSALSSAHASIRARYRRALGAIVGAIGLQQHLGWDIRAAAARFWPSTRCPYTSFVMATLECPRTSETT